MKVISSEQFKTYEQESAIQRNQNTDQVVLEIIQKVRNDGDDALFHYAKQLDKVSLNSLEVTKEEFQAAHQEVTPEFIRALKKAKENITTFHKQQKEDSWSFQKPDGVMLGQQVTPLDKVGVYIPGGKAAYPSTVLMNVIPAKIAGVPSIFIATPPQTDGTINPHVLAVAQMLGIDRVYKMGGAQAVAAFAYGTKSVPKVDKIVGPGNDYVARAKKWVYGDVAIDMIAGPSEICVIADETAPAEFVAADLLSQAEHDEAATAICITFSKELAEEIQKAVHEQLQKLDRRQIAETSINNNGSIIIAESLDDAFKVVNEIAPEHLQLMIDNATDYLPSVKHAGAIFLGNYSPEPLGDYMAGPNHTLPTSGTAKFASPLGVYDFMKKSSIIHYSKTALLKEADAIEQLARTEGLNAHANSITIRRGKGK